MNELDEFYYNILNIKKINVTLDLIRKIVREKISEIYKRTSDISGLCKVVADILLTEFNKFGINTLLFDIKDLCNIDYSHEFLIVYFKQGAYLNYVLIDPTYIQFVKKEGKLNSKFKNYPSEILKETKKGQELLELILKDGLSLVDSNTINLYLKSFNPSASYFDLDNSFITYARKH